MRNEDVRQILFARQPGELRGQGPLQLCGAAVSVAVESQSYAANFFAEGGVPSVLIKSSVPLSPEEAQDLKAQWSETPSNVPRVIDPDIDSVQDFGLDPEKAQLTETRRFAKGDVSDMFGIPGPFVNYVESGSSLTYQNIAQVYDQLLKACLLPNYIEPIEQTFSDLLSRSTVARFNTEALLRADVKTRYEVYASGITSGVLTVEEARTREGLAPGDVERAAVPFAPPQAVPDSLPIQQRSAPALRCRKCDKLLAEYATPPYRIVCPRCKAVAEDATEMRVAAPAPPAVVNAYINLPGQAAQPITVNNNMPEQAAPVTHVTVEQPAITVEPTPIEMHVAPSPVEVRNEVNVDRSPVEVTVEPTPVTIHNEIAEPKPTSRASRRKVPEEVR
jgi:phage FluMu protein Com